MTQIQLAEQIARKAHEGQFRRDGITPYITHVERVVSLLSIDADKVVAWLHDTIEDTEETYASLAKKGIETDFIDSVLQLTKSSLSADYYQYINKLRSSADRSAIAVKIVDIVDNLTDKPTGKQINKYVMALNILTIL